MKWRKIENLPLQSKKQLNTQRFITAYSRKNHSYWLNTEVEMTKKYRMLLKTEKPVRDRLFQICIIDLNSLLNLDLVSSKNDHGKIQ